MTTRAFYSKTAVQEEVIVVFQSQITHGFWNWFTSPGWRHCWVMMPVYYPKRGLMAKTFAMKIEPLRWGIHTALWWESPEVVAREFLLAGATSAVRVKVTIPPFEGRFIPRGMFNCVTICKAVLGIRSFWVWTPRQLFAYLVRNGGRLLK